MEQLDTNQLAFDSKVALVTESATVLGIDIAPVQRATVPNCRFQFDNVNWGWPRTPLSFDLIRGSKLLGNVNDWRRIFQGAYKTLMPGGLLELYDTPFSYLFVSDQEAPSWKSVSQQAHELGKRTNCSFSIAHGMYMHHMEAAGFVDIKETWETTEVTEYVLHDVESMLRLSWYLQDMDKEAIRARLADWRSRLKSEAGNVNVQQYVPLFAPTDVLACLLYTSDAADD